MSSESVPGLNHRGNEGEGHSAGGENRSRRRTGFIDQVFNLVQNVLQKHEIPGQFDGCSE